jgi:RecA-family ATPase
MIAVNEFELFPLDSPEAEEQAAPSDWLWHGYLARGDLTLLTSQWKAGKTTLLTGLLHQFAAGGELLGQAVTPAKIIVVSEESRQHWTARKQEIPLGGHVRLLARPFPARPAPADWNRLIDFALAQRAASELDCFVVDPLATFLPGKSDSDPGTLLELLNPLRRLASAGVAVLILHHPRKEASEEGHTARGSGALLGYVDVILELHRAGKLKSDRCSRRLIGLSRHRATPAQVIFEWTPGTPQFAVLPDPYVHRYRQNWEQVKKVLEQRETSATHAELLNDWPPESEKPSKAMLYEWLNRAYAEKLVRRLGDGTKGEPYRYRLPHELDTFYERRKASRC